MEINSILIFAYSRRRSCSYRSTLRRYNRVIQSFSDMFGEFVDFPHFMRLCVECIGSQSHNNCSISSDNYRSIKSLIISPILSNNCHSIESLNISSISSDDYYPTDCKDCRLIAFLGCSWLKSANCYSWFKNIDCCWCELKYKLIFDGL